MTTLSELRDAYYATTNRKGTVILTKPTWRRPFLTGQAEDSASGISTGGVLLAAASLLLLALAIAMGITSFHAQYAYIFAAKRQHIASALEALGLDCGAVIFSLLGIALARLGRRAVVERTLVVLCALGSCGMNALNANLGSPRSVAVYAMPPVLFALTSDRLVSVIRRAALGPAEDSDDQRSAWRLAGRAALYVLRLAAAPPSTASGVRRMLLNATPLPAKPEGYLPSPARTQACMDAIRRGEVTAEPGSFWAAKAAEQAAERARKPTRRRPSKPTKTERFLALASDRHGPLAGLPLDRVGAVAAELAPEVGLHQGSARTALRAAVLAAQDGAASS